MSVNKLEIERKIKAIEFDEDLILAGFDNVMEEFVSLYKDIARQAIKSRGGEVLGTLIVYADEVGIPNAGSEFLEPSAEIRVSPLMGITPDMERWIDKRAYEFWEEVSTTTKDELKNIIKESLIAGESNDELQLRISELFDDTVRGNAYRARMIARTETTSALNYASLEAYNKSGVVHKKQWLAILDKNTRKEHAEANGQIRNMTEAFIVGGYPMMHPGDVHAPAHLVVHCRCTTLPIVDGYEADAEALQKELEGESVLG